MAGRQPDKDQVERLVVMLRRAHIGAYVELFPHHKGAAQTFAENPELKELGSKFYSAVAQRLIHAGVSVAISVEAAPRPRAPRKQAKKSEDVQPLF